jgi:hypothetical protein
MTCQDSTEKEKSFSLFELHESLLLLTSCQTSGNIAKEQKRKTTIYPPKNFPVYSANLTFTNDVDRCQ